MDHALWRRPATACWFLLMSLLLGGCAAKAERVYLAPSDATVTARLEAAYDGRGQHIVVENRSTVQIVVTSLHLRDCQNIRNRCDVVRMRTPVRPGQRYQLATVRPANLNQAYNFLYSWSWEVSETGPEVSR
jgi:hypothetical protein